MLILKAFGLIGFLMCVLYMLMIMPRVVNKPSSEPFTRVLYAHRGLHDNRSSAPENSMAAFRKAVEAGYGIECDVQLTRDGVPVIFHDFTLARIARYPDGCVPADAVPNPDGSLGVKGKVVDYTYEELLQFHLLDSDEKIPKFEEFLQMVNGTIPIIVELKIELKDLAVCRKVDELLEDYKGIYCIESFNPLGVMWYRKNRPQVFRGQLSDAFHKDKPEEFQGPLYFILTNLLFNFLTRPDFIAFNHKYANCLARRICRRVYGNVAAAWTIKSEEELAKARKHFDIFIFDSFVPQSGPKA